MRHHGMRMVFNFDHDRFAFEAAKCLYNEDGLKIRGSAKVECNPANSEKTYSGNLKVKTPKMGDVKGFIGVSFYFLMIDNIRSMCKKVLMAYKVA